ncbi:hypothetical protein LUZ61_002930 [Rhynchospora tenuis]|uniref:PGG domain-containing protein n=1 Tax=Rhynchospora tenuis TaxID=198213 RepID=A0AAD5ZK08_9POAL|nr:hypothetical protein LUZ61_002930 [Rhynchospora tenuis]
MSHEITLSTVPPQKHASPEIQQQLPPPYACPSTVQPVDPTPTAQMGPPNGVEQANASRHDPERQKWFEDMRGWIMVVAVLVASVTYTSGLNPPGGFWQDDNGHEAGDSILHDKSFRRYTTFFYANATAFMASLVIIILLMNEKFYCNKSKVVMLNISMVLGLVSLMIAYAAGCARRFSTSIYVIVLAVGVLVFVIYSARVLPYICSCVSKRAPLVPELLGRDIFISTQSSSLRAREEHN